MISTAPFDRDLNDIGLPFTDINCDILFVVNPSREKSSLDSFGMSLLLGSGADLFWSWTSVFLVGPLLSLDAVLGAH